MRRPAGILTGMLSAMALVACHGESALRDAFPWGKSPPAEKVALHAELHPDTVDLLGEADVVLDLWWRSGLVPELSPELPDSLEVVDRRRTDVARDGGTWRRVVLRVRALRPGEIVVPAQRARAGGAEAHSEKLRLGVKSVLAEADGGEPEAPAAPFPPPPSRWPAIVGAVAVLALVVAALLWRRRRRRTAPQAPEIPAHVRALAELEELEHAPRRTSAEIDAFYVTVSDVVRRYLEARFGLHAPERTTDEFLVELGSSDALDGEQRRALAEFLHQCDLVKFARALPGEAVHRRSLATARDLVEATRPDRLREGAA